MSNDSAPPLPPPPPPSRPDVEAVFLELRHGDNPPPNKSGD